MAKPKTKTKAQSVSDYIKKTYDRIEIKVPKDIAAAFRAACDDADTNPNRLINQWIQSFIETPPTE